MPNCPRCGAEVTEDMTFCPNCGASLKAAPGAPPAPRREEARGEKREKGEKAEKYEKRGTPWRGPLIAGLILILVGSVILLGVTGLIDMRVAWPLFLIIVGIVLVVSVVSGTARAKRRHPQT